MILSLTTVSHVNDVDLWTRISYLMTLLYTFKCILNMCIHIKNQLFIFIHVCMKYSDIKTYDSNVCNIDSSLEQLFETQININLTYIKINMVIILWTHHYYIGSVNVYTQFKIYMYTLTLIFSNLAFINISYALCHMAKQGFGVCVSNHLVLLKVNYG